MRRRSAAKSARGERAELHDDRPKGGERLGHYSVGPRGRPQSSVLTRPASSPVVIMRSADIGFGKAPGPLSVLVLVAVKNPKNEAVLESIRFSFSDNLIWIVGFVLKS